jgi:hypothetical protein
MAKLVPIADILLDVLEAADNRRKRPSTAVLHGMLEARLAGHCSVSTITVEALGGGYVVTYWARGRVAGYIDAWRVAFVARRAGVLRIVWDHPARDI